MNIINKNLKRIGLDLESKKTVLIEFSKYGIHKVEQWISE